MDNDIERTLILKQIASQASEDFLTKSQEYTIKNVEESKRLRTLGNTFYVKKIFEDKNMKESFRLYSKSIAFAPVDSVDLALAYGNRSALLFRMKKYEECIADINRIINIIDKCDIAFKLKILCRKVECLKLTGSSSTDKEYNKIENLLRTAEEQSDNNNVNSLEKTKKELSRLKTLNIVQKRKLPKKSVPAVLQRKPNSVSITYDSENGRSLVANRDLEPGEVVLVETPHTSCLTAYEFHTHCGHCLAKSWVTIPCDFCNWCMFCSEKCKNAAWKSYHNIECATISYFLSYREFNHYIHLSLRCFLMGIKESGNIANFIADVQSLDCSLDQLRKELSTDTMLPNTFKSVYTLDHKVSTDILEKYAVDSTMILMSLFKFTCFFGQHSNFKDLKHLSKNENFLFFGSVLLRLRTRFTKSVHILCDISKLNGDEADFNYSDKTAKYQLNLQSHGATVVPLCSFARHSCAPNVKICRTNSNEVVVYALQPIKKHSQLYMAYQFTYYEILKSFRQKHIQINLDFVCKCEACSNEWPSITELYKMPKTDPLLYRKKYYEKREEELFNELTPLVAPILYDDQRVTYDQAILNQLAKATNKVFQELQQPSVVLSEMMTALSITFEKLYCSV